ncbi:MAG TPA: serine/threonine-protein kinase [Polyangiaceae bacterium]
MAEIGTGDLVAGRYRLIEQIGGGGMGLVFRARDERGGPDVAVKVLRALSVEASRRLLREARATERLDPDRVARVLETGVTEAGRAFLVMTYIPGDTLRAIVRGGRLPRSEALRVLRELSMTLDEAHRCGLVHRDVKPDNIIVRGDGRVVLLDFGIVKDLAPSDDVAQVTTQLTFEGAMVGTPAYLAPEQALGREIGPAADQFALAVTAYEILTGRLPWTASEVPRILAQVLADTPPPASAANHELPSTFDGVLQRGMSKSPQERFPSVEAFTRALDAAENGVQLSISPASTTLADLPTRARPLVTAQTSPGQSPLRRSPRLRGSLLVGTIAGALGLVTLFARHASAPPTPQLVARHPFRFSAETPLACPVFDVEGAPEVAIRVGAAASSAACLRARWYLGGLPERVQVPAALLDVPVQPSTGLRDPYEDPAVRTRTLEIARRRGLPTLDGTVSKLGDGWRVELVVRAADGGEVARSPSIEETQVGHAVRTAMTRLWQTPPLAIEPLDPEVARWTALPDVEAGLSWLDALQNDPEGCDSIRQRGGQLGPLYAFLRTLCPGARELSDAGTVAIDESSGAGLVTTFWTFPPDRLSEEEARGIAPKVDEFRSSEASRHGRAALGYVSGLIWGPLGEGEKAHRAFLAAVADDPLNSYIWYQLAYMAGQSGREDTTRLLASIWFPQEAAFLPHTSELQSDSLEERVRNTKLAYLLEPTLPKLVGLGRALAEAGRAEEVRALLTSTLNGRGIDSKVSDFVLGYLDLHDAMLGRAMGHFENDGGRGLENVQIIATVLGRVQEKSMSWATSFLQMQASDAEALGNSHPATVALCMAAGAHLAQNCIARVEALSAKHNSWRAGGDAFLAGAKRYAAGDLRGAVNAWRPIVGTSNDAILRLLPTAAFDRVGEHDLAARIDERKLHYRQLAGVSEATPREAYRAFERGEHARATELAQSVVHAWEAADTTIPAVADMKALLARMRD